MIRNNRCAAEISGPARMPGKTIVLNRHRWSGIVQNLHRCEAERFEMESERKYHEYLRSESQAMTKKWENSLDKIREKKNRERAQKEQDKIHEGMPLILRF